MPVLPESQTIAIEPELTAWRPAQGPLLRVWCASLHADHPREARLETDRVNRWVIASIDKSALASGFIRGGVDQNVSWERRCSRKVGFEEGSRLGGCGAPSTALDRAARGQGQ
jgi:hypothetical protein